MTLFMPSKLKDHLKMCHPDKIRKYLKYFQTLKKKFHKKPTVESMFFSNLKGDDGDLRVSYNILLLKEKSEKPHTIEEQLILPDTEKI